MNSKLSSASTPSFQALFTRLIFQGISRISIRIVRFLTLSLTGITIGFFLSSCQKSPPEHARNVVIEQSWELDLGDAIEGFPVVGSLGDISVYLKGNIIRAPFDGEVERSAIADGCIIFSSPEVPAYLFRFCGLNKIHFGKVKQGQKMGRAEYLHFATMRRQPEGTWAIVEPSKNVLERSLERF